MHGDCTEAINRLRDNIDYWMKRSGCKEIKVKHVHQSKDGNIKERDHTARREMMNIRDGVDWDWKKYHSM